MAELKLLLDDDPPGGPEAYARAAALSLARARLKPPMRREGVWRLLGAAGFAAAAALTLAATVIVGPPQLTSERVDVNPWMR